MSKGRLASFCEDITGSLFGIEAWPFELMQFTGLKDKNGREIYEGDIVVQNAYLWFDDGKRSEK